MDRNAGDDGALALNDDRFALLPEVGTLRLDVESVQQLFHGSAFLAND